VGVEGGIEPGGIGDPADVAGSGLPDFQRSLAGRRPVPVVVILSFDVGPETGVEFVKRGDLFCVDRVQESLTEGPPPAIMPSLA